MWYVLLWQQFPNPKQIPPKGDNKCYLDLEFQHVQGLCFSLSTRLLSPVEY